MKNIALILIAALTFSSSGLAYQVMDSSDANQTQTINTAQSDKAKAEVQRRGVGEKSRVRVKLRNNGEEVKGYISHIDEASFQVTDPKSGQVSTINYADVQKVKGRGLSTGAKIGIASAIVGGVLVVATLLTIATAD
jgi:hypothetical protein